MQWTIFNFILANLSEARDTVDSFLYLKLLYTLDLQYLLLFFLSVWLHLSFIQFMWQLKYFYPPGFS